MATPTEATVQFGPWPRYADMQGWIRSSAPIYDKTTGAAIFSSARGFVLNDEGLATIKLPFTDDPRNNPANFTYELRWVSGYQSAPPSWQFKLPRISPSVKYITMVPSPTAPSIYVPADSILSVNPSTSPPDPSSPTGTLTGLVHTQSTPAASWVIDHTLNKIPSVVLLVGGQHVYSDLEYPSKTRVTVTWPVPTSGEAHLI